MPADLGFYMMVAISRVQAGQGMSGDRFGQLAAQLADWLCRGSAVRGVLPADIRPAVTVSVAVESRHNSRSVSDIHDPESEF